MMEIFFNVNGTNSEVYAEFQISEIKLTELILKIEGKPFEWVSPADALKSVRDSEESCIEPMLISEDCLEFIICNDGSHFKCELSEANQKKFWTIKVQNLEAEALVAIIHIAASEMFSVNALANRVYAVLAMATGTLYLCRSRGYYMLNL